MLKKPQQSALALQLSVGQKPRGDAAPPELLILQHGEVQRKGRLQARDRELVEGPKTAAYGGPAVPGVHDELRQEGVVVRGHHVAGVEVRVDPDARPAWRIVDLDEPGLGQEVAAGVLGVDPELDRVPVGREGVLRDLQTLARGHLQLLGDDVDAGDHLRHGMLDLEAGVHLDKVELSARVDELHGARALVTQGADQVGRGRHESLSYVLRQARRRRFLDELLVAALDGAVPLGEGYRLTVSVGEDLYLHVPEPLQVFLDVDRAVAEVGRGLPTRAEVGGLDLGLCLGHPHPLPTTPGARLDDQRIADLGADALDLLHSLARAVGAGCHGDARLGGRFVTHPGDGARGGADELQADPLADLGEAGVLGKETVAGMDGLGARKLGGGDDRRHVQVTAHRRRRADADRLVGQLVVQGVPVGGGVDGDAPSPQLAAGPDYAQRDLAAVRYEDLADHYCSSGRK